MEKMYKKIKNKLYGKSVFYFLRTSFHTSVYFNIKITDNS